MTALIGETGRGLQGRVCGCSLALALLAAGCAAPSARFDQMAEHTGLTRLEMNGAGLRHAVYLPRRPLREGPVHVYLSGDGRPYIRPTLPAADPTPRRPVILELMAQDRGPRLLLGRPCYHGLARSRGCSADLWTDARLGETVRDSMVAALGRLITPEHSVVLIGYSGGGALAILLARRLPRVKAVVTLAGNLDPAAWTRLHGLSPLDGSLEPTAGGPLPPELVQRHYAGELDRTIPPGLIAAAARRLGSEVRVLPGASHGRGWSRQWPALLAEIRRASEEHCTPPCASAQGDITVSALPYPIRTEPGLIP